MENTKFNFSSIKKEKMSVNNGFDRESNPYREDHPDTPKYMKFGSDNMYPEYLISLYNQSSTHASCVNAIVQAITGEGLITDDEDILKVANREGESWNDIFGKVALDYKLFGGYALEIIYSRDRSKIAEVYHVDFSHVRAMEKNDRNKIPGFYISSEWKPIWNYNIQQDDKELPQLPAFNLQKRADEPKQMLYHNPYRPGQQYYPLPDYVGGSKVIDLDQEVDNFHISNIKNGLAPSLAITTYTNANDEERMAIENMLRLQYEGTSNAGNMLYMDVADPSLKPDITPIPQNGADDYYTTLNDVVAQKILTSHRITSPALLGIKENTGLGNNAEELETAYRLFLNTVVLPFQQSILATFEGLLELNFGDITLGVVQKNPLFEYDDAEEAEVVTSQESDIEDEAILDEKIEDSSPLTA
jgi:hypothetical protein|tara:strand:+ start:892 stop:2139 length:1248 start_codon:yes stop_codon:yes gene_type:complete